MNTNEQNKPKKVTMQRLFKQDMDIILNCYKKYDNLFYNPIDSNHITDILLCGQIWGAFYDNKLIACCYFFPMCSTFFKSENTYSYLCDFISEPKKYMFTGYIGTDFDCLSENDRIFFTDELNKSNGLYTAFLNIVQMQTFRAGLKYIIHTIPIKMCSDLEPMFSAGYKMIKMRGLEKLVVHYIFAKSIFPCDDIYCTNQQAESLKYDITNTKAISALLESGYCCVDITKENDKCLLLFQRLIAD